MAFRNYFGEATTIRRPRHLLRVTYAGIDLPAGLLVGLEDREGRELGIGVIAETPRAGGEIKLLVPAVGEQIYAIRPGLLILDQSFRERHVPYPST